MTGATAEAHSAERRSEEGATATARPSRTPNFEPGRGLRKLSGGAATCGWRSRRGRQSSTARAPSRPPPLLNRRRERPRATGPPSTMDTSSGAAIADLPGARRGDRAGRRRGDDPLARGALGGRRGLCWSCCGPARRAGASVDPGSVAGTQARAWKGLAVIGEPAGVMHRGGGEDARAAAADMSALRGHEAPAQVVLTHPAKWAKWAGTLRAGARGRGRTAASGPDVLIGLVCPSRSRPPGGSTRATRRAGRSSSRSYTSGLGTFDTAIFERMGRGVCAPRQARWRRRHRRQRFDDILVEY